MHKYMDILCSSYGPYLYSVHPMACSVCIVYIDVFVHVTLCSNSQEIVDFSSFQIHRMALFNQGWTFNILVQLLYTTLHVLQCALFSTVYMHVLYIFPPVYNVTYTVQYIRQSNILSTFLSLSIR